MIDKTSPPPAVAMPYCMVDGQLRPVAEKHISILDRGFLLADGVFETILVKNGVAQWWGEHMARLRQGASVLRIDFPHPASGLDEAKLLADVGRLLAANEVGGGDYVLRLTLSRGVVAGRGLWPASLEKTAGARAVAPTVALALYPHGGAASSSSPSSPYVAGAAINLGLSPLARCDHHGPLVGVKWLGAYGNGLAALASARGGDNPPDDLVVMNGDDVVVSTTVGNIFLLFADGWRTPRPADGIICGTARAKIIASGLLAVREETIPASCLSVKAGKELLGGFVANCLGLRIIGKVAGQALPAVPQVMATCHQLAGVLW